MAQPQREVRGLRNDLRESCAAVDGRLLVVLEALEKGLVGGEVREELLRQLDRDVTPEAGVPTRIVGQSGPVETKVAEGTVTVANPTDVTPVKAAVEDNSETFNSSAWAIAGLFVGFGLLVVIWKLVRP